MRRARESSILCDALKFKSILAENIMKTGIFFFLICLHFCAHNFKRLITRILQICDSIIVYFNDFIEISNNL